MVQKTSGIIEFLSHVTSLLGTDNVRTETALLGEYSAHSLPMPNRIPSAVLYPACTADVQAIVHAANTYSVPLFPISTGWNLGLGSRAPVVAGQVIIDLGGRMNKIFEIDEELGYCVVEPGVTFAAMHEELQLRGSSLAISPTSGPPLGGLLGNALDKGGGAGPNGSHFENLCGLEVVLGNGDIIRTGEGGLAANEHPNWHVTKFSFGPALDGLFTQSNFGIVTRAGMWLGRRPPHVRSFFFTFDEDDDFEEIVRLAYSLKAAGVTPAMIRVTNDLYLLSAQGPSSVYDPAGKCRAMTTEERRALRGRHGLGAWTVAGALYGPDAASVQPALERVRATFLASGRARYVSNEQAETMSALSTALDINNNRPAGQELEMLNWRGGGAIWFTPGMPMRSATAQECTRESRAVCAHFGIDYMVSFVCGLRFARGVHALLYNRTDPEETARADACYRAMSEVYSRRGIFVGRAPTEYQGYHHSQRTAEINNACHSIKQALDPNGIIAPGRYGIL